MKGSDLIFNYVHLLYYKCLKVNLNQGGSCIVSLDWVKYKKATINPNNNDDKRFQYAVMVVLNNEEIGKHLETFIDKFYKHLLINIIEKT